jgi:hypothetical protein
MGNFDVDDVDFGTSEFQAPSPEEPLRATVRTLDGSKPETDERCTEGLPCGTVWTSKGGINAMRVAYTTYEGAHDFPAPDACRPFDVATYYSNLVGYFFHKGGTELPDDLCLSHDSCDYFPWEAAPADSE